ncbi:MAG TPA: hypothetical protein VGO04_06440 [Ensifer sp.]|uniref:hypothetical protein n=1 Tax=Ensifer sp. TaxID=1872086 RepID=UPI002E0D6148|nr:hypothetical protein [Ensifer sp.]
MHSSRGKRTEQLTLAADPELRRAIEVEAARRDTSLSSTVRVLIRTALAAQAANIQATTR